MSTNDQPARLNAIEIRNIVASKANDTIHDTENSLVANGATTLPASPPGTHCIHILATTDRIAIASDGGATILGEFSNRNCRGKDLQVI